jgi:hypothetical protein
VSGTVEFGGWPRPPRWVWVIAGVAAVAVLAGVVVARTGPYRAAPASAVTTPAVAGNGGPRMPRKPARMTGRPLPRGAGLRLVLGGRRPAWLWVPAGRAEPVRGLPGPNHSYQLIRVAGGWAALRFPGSGVWCGDTCAPPPVPVYYIADRSREATRLGTADFVAPAAATGAVWLVRYRAAARMPATAGTAQQVSVSGAALGPRRRLPRGYVIDQGTAAGLLLVSAPGTAAVRYQLWDPRTRRAVRRFPDLLAVSPGAIAWAPACPAACTVHVLNLDGGPGRVIPLPGRSQAYAGAFSPDGRLLALLVTARTGAGGRAVANRLAVAAVAGGRLTAVPGTTIGAGIGIDFGWQPGTGQLVAALSLQGGWQVAVWRPGDAHLYVAVTRAPADSWPVVGPGPY